MQNFYQVVQKRFSSQNTYVTGHSLGGAISLELAAEYQAKGVTFVAPNSYQILSPEAKERVANGDTKDLVIDYTNEGLSLSFKKHHIFQNMSRKANGLDNSPMENFSRLLKQEIYYGYIYSHFFKLKKAIENYIDYYNHWKNPVEFRLAHLSIA